MICLTWLETRIPSYTFQQDFNTFIVINSDFSTCRLHQEAQGLSALIDTPQMYATKVLNSMHAVFTKEPSAEDVIGGVSLVVWTITSLVLVKYAFIVLRADDNGQGYDLSS